jgi:TIR domain
MYDVFISYARQERQHVEPIKNLLERAGFRVFFDIQGIDTGDEFPDVIDQALKQAAVVVAIWSPYALTRPWVKRECRVAHARGVLIPVAIKSLDPVKDVPTEFFGIHYHELFTNDVRDSSEAWQTLVAAIRRRFSVQPQVSPGVDQPRSQLLRRPKIYISDYGALSSILVDIERRLLSSGFDVGERKTSYYYLDTATAYYEQFDIAIIAHGREAEDKWSHAEEEIRLLSGTHVFVYFEPINMANIGYGARVSGYVVLHLEDWSRRPEACFLELLAVLREILIKIGWTCYRTDLPDLELVCRDYWASSVNTWKRPLTRAGFTLRDQSSDSLERLPHSEIGRARFSLFVWGTAATEQDIDDVIMRAKQGSAIVALVDHEVTIPDSIRELCNIFDLRSEDLNKSIVGTEEWERMVDVLRSAKGMSLGD